MGRMRLPLHERPIIQKNHPLFIEMKKKIAPNINMNKFTKFIGIELRKTLFNINKKLPLIEKQEMLLYGKTKKK